MIYKDGLEQLAQLPMKDMQIHSVRKVEVYRSSNPELTGKYHGRYYADGSAFFELAFFQYEYGKSQIFIRYPHTDFFIEMTGGTGSAWGSMTSTSGRNYSEEEISDRKNKKATFELFKHETQALLKFDSMSFNFLTRVEDETIINEIFTRKFLPLPDKRRIAYAFITSDNKYLIQDYSVTNGIPSRTWFGNITDGLKLAKIEKHVVYRDGGTTYFDMIVDGVTHKFYSPTPFDKDKKATLDGNEINKIDGETLNVLVAALSINLQTEKEY